MKTQLQIHKVRVYFTDDESDTITIGSGSVPSGFTFTKAVHMFS